ncbi:MULTISPECIES: MoaD/ThiS family protein [unclassified Sphingobacterium]|uniref:MoaD/ThiS family protein n=1 Tax=unclassified Sphingobacterium TaxID=2609468 RepID=UPI0025D52B36|nr:MULTISPECIES: MoaD/ThiS family protein [unclassified Sphingobacterium]
MKIKVRTFGSLTEILSQEFFMESTDTETLINTLYSQQPQLIERKLLIAVNHTIVRENTALMEHDVVALMPPYSGG